MSGYAAYSCGVFLIGLDLFPTLRTILVAFLTVLVLRNAVYGQIYDVKVSQLADFLVAEFKSITQIHKRM
jgi:hypothetical protein